MLELIIQNQQKEFEVPSEEKMMSWAEQALLQDKDTQVTLRIVDADESQALNKEYRGKDKPTNVLSFPMEMPDEFSQVLEMNLLGDLVVCAAVVDQESKQQNKSVESHWAHILTHGMLHLQGYDHIDDREATEMEALEIKILKQSGFDDPYQFNADE